MKVAVIPARGGSQRIPRKNIKLFCGKPMIAWSIEAALASQCFERVWVSTDDAEIAEVARAYGAEVPYIRPADLSDHHTGTIPVIAHAIEWGHLHKMEISAVCCIYATAPLIDPYDLKNALDVLNQTKSDYVFTATSYAFPIQRAFSINEQQGIEMFDAKQFNTRSQDLVEAFHDAGQFYWGQPAAWVGNKPIFSRESRAFILPRYRVQDIDTAEDWTQAELMFRQLQLRNAAE